MKGVRLKALGVALLGALALMFAGCGQQGGGSQAPTKGSLTVNVSPADAQVQVTGPGRFNEAFTGGKTLTDLAPGDYTVQASKAGYFTASATHKVKAGERTTVVLNLLPVPPSGPTEGKVAVLVVNGNGNPIPGAMVSDGSQSATTNAQGRADLTYTAAGTYAISVNASGYLGAAQLASVELGKTVALTFKLQPVPPSGPTEGKVAVLVVNGNGSPIPGAMVSDGSQSATTNAQGRADLTYTAAGTYAISVNASGYLGAAQLASVELGKTVALTFKLQPVPPSGPTEGKVAVLVVNGNGSPIPGAMVSDGSQSATTNAQGRADLTYTAAGTYAISVNASGYLGAAQLASVELGKTVALTFKLQPQPAPAPTTGTLVVHVYGADTGQTLSGSSVVSNPALTFSGSGGLFTATAAPGTYAVTASASGYLSGSRAANVEAGKTTVLNIGLQRNTASGPVGGIEIVSVKDQWGADLPVERERNEAKDVNLYASQTEEPVCVTVRVTKDGQPVQNARVRVTAVSANPQAVALYKGCETQNVSQLDFVMTDANGIAKFSFQGLGIFPVAPSGEPVKFLVSASEEGSGWTARSKEFKVFFYNITHLYLRDGGDDDSLGTSDDILRYTGKRTGHDFGTIVNAFDFSNPAKNRHLFRAEVRQKQPTTDPFPITGFGYVRYELVGGDVSKVDLCDLSPDRDPENPIIPEGCANPVVDADGSGILVRPKSSVTAGDLPLSVRVKATLVVAATYGSSTYYFPLKDFTFTKTWTGAALAIEKTGPSVIGWSGINLLRNDVTLVASGAGVPSGATYTYTITVRNLSATETATNVVITDPLPAELGFVSASADGTYDPFLHQVTWNQTTTPALTRIPPGGSVSVQVTVYARHKPGYSWNDKDGDTLTDRDTQFGGPGYYFSGRPPAYLGTPYPDPYAIDNPAQARGDNTPLVSTTKRIYVVRPFFTLTKTPSTATVFQGDRVRFTLTLTNQDRAEAPINDPDYRQLKTSFPADYAAALTGYSVRLRDLFGAGLDYVNSSPVGTLDANGKTLTWDLGNLALGASRQILVDLLASEVGSWNNCARLYAYNLNQFPYLATYPRWNVPPTQLEPTSGTDPRPSPPYTLETSNPDSVGNYLEKCAEVVVQPRPTAYALAISSLGEFTSLTGGTSTDPVANGSEYVYRFEIRAWEGSSGPQTNVTLRLTRTAGNSTFAGTGVKGVDFEVELDRDGPLGTLDYQTVLNSEVTVISWTATGVTIQYNPGLNPGATLRFSVRANAVNGTNTTVQADASSAQAPGPYIVFETTTIIP